MKKCIYLITLFLLAKCSPVIPVHIFDDETPKSEPIYRNLNYWAAHPDKFDQSDLLPKNLVDDTLCLDSIDVFFIYPTIYTSGDQWNADVNDEKLNKKINNSTIANQASVFTGIANVYAPIYRQMHIHGYEDISNGIKAFDVAYKDVENAFKYYLKHFNNGNRIVIAAHSQGTNHAEKLFTDFLIPNDSILKKVELAYLIGMPINKLNLNYPACDRPNDLNCFLSWRTFSYGFYTSYKYGDEIPVTNPVSWRKNGSQSLYSSHKGILFKNGKLKYPQSVSAVVNQGILWVSFQSIPMQKLFERNDYHIADYNLFWMDIRTNFYERMKK
tara:strand:- start:135 stop:1118 length:984 start_codon:yes stop_codon:yes gene_type:complete